MNSDPHLRLEPLDPYLWLENIDFPEALAWVEAQNAVSTSQLEALPMFDQTRERIQAALDSSEKIPFVTVQNGWLYNFWRDQTHVRGIWRRTRLESYKTNSPEWEVLLDVDALAANEGKSWVFQQALREPTGHKRALIFLSDGGKDASEVREFDLESKTFCEDGFYLPAAKSRVAWENPDTLLVATDFGEGSLNNSGYGRLLKRWKRRQKLEDATLVFESTTKDILVVPICQTEAPRRVFVQCNLDFYSNELFWLRGETLQKLKKQNSAEAHAFNDWLLLELREAWGDYPQGALLIQNLEAAFAGGQDWKVLFAPTEQSALTEFVLSKNTIVLNILENVQNRLVRLTPSGTGWQNEPIPTAENATLNAWAYDRQTSDQIWLEMTGFIAPTTLMLDNEVIKTTPHFFDATNLVVQQFFAISSDGTRIPYFQIGAKNLEPSRKHPTILYGYGGFEVSQLPFYSPGVGIGWLERGGVYVVANIRGGGEFGPRWHRAALRENRQRAFDDFIAVAEDLQARKVCSPNTLGIRGGSNGGLLMGAMFTQRPELFGAVVCTVPLLDMRRYHLLLAGSLWVAEYGDPDNPKDWEFIQKYSPYQNVIANKTYPAILFTTSTRDDRVHPGHARKMTAKMLEQGHNVLYFENTEGGHAGAANNPQVARKLALEYSFFSEKLQ